MQVTQPLQTGVGNGDHTHIGVNGAEGVVGGFSTGVGDCIKQSGLADVGQTDDTKFHILLLLLCILWFCIARTARQWKGRLYMQ